MLRQAISCQSLYMTTAMEVRLAHPLEPRTGTGLAAQLVNRRDSPRLDKVCPDTSGQPTLIV